MPKFLADLLARLLPAPQESIPAEQAVDRVAGLVEEVLETLGVGEAQEESEEGLQWGLQVGSAPLTIALRPNEILGEPTLEVTAPILRLPEHNLLAFYRRCLELNRIVVGCAFGVDNDLVVVAAERRLPGLERAQFVEMLLDVASAADQFDDELAKEFGAERLGDDPAVPSP